MFQVDGTMGSILLFLFQDGDFSQQFVAILGLKHPFGQPALKTLIAPTVLVRTSFSQGIGDVIFQEKQVFAVVGKKGIAPEFKHQPQGILEIGIDGFSQVNRLLCHQIRA
jgi:hypothetical protein